jgi:hypothetical protein
MGEENYMRVKTSGEIPWIDSRSLQKKPTLHGTSLLITAPPPLQAFLRHLCYSFALLSFILNCCVSAPCTGPLPKFGLKSFFLFLGTGEWRLTFYTSPSLSYVYNGCEIFHHFGHKFGQKRKRVVVLGTGSI